MSTDSLSAVTSNAFRLQIPRESKILQGNIDRNANIKLLQERWPCDKAGCGTYCFVNAKGEHTPLSHAMLDVWAMAMVNFIC